MTLCEWCEEPVDTHTTEGLALCLSRLRSEAAPPVEGEAVKERIIAAREALKGGKGGEAVSGSGEREPQELSWHQIARVLKDAAWEGRWEPLDETNVGPLAGITGAVLVDEFARMGLKLVAVPAGGTEQEGEHNGA